MQDLTRDDIMLALLRDPWADEFDDFDFEEAIYWFANDWHGGQGSNLYSALSTSEFHPSPIASGVDPASPAGLLYDELVLEYGSPEDKARHGLKPDGQPAAGR